MNCLNCGKETSNPKYCCRSCAALSNGKLFPKRKTTRTCSHCDTPVKSYRHTLCEQHWAEHQRTKHRGKTIGEYRNYPSVKGKHPSWLHTHVRQFARSWLKHLVKQPCKHCGYTKHVELAHIRDVASFPDDALLGDINSEDNVIPLCPNCHWEFDNLPRS